MACCALVACKQNDVNFVYSPAEPRAGEAVTFTNLSTSGEDWAWTFGDGTSSTLRSPSHIYKKPGTFTVTLRVDGRSAWTASKEITVYDTVPTFVASDTAFTVYKDYTFTAQVYNPYNHPVEYLWYLPLADAQQPPYAVITDTVLTGTQLHLYFTRDLYDAGIGLRVIMDDDTIYVPKYFDVSDRPANSVLMRTSESDYRQRIFGDRATDPKQLAAADPLLDAEQDTLQRYNDSTFTLPALAEIFPGIQGFHIANRKLYYRADGLWVANLDGSYRVQIDEAECAAMTLDVQADERIYWANADGVWYMPLVTADNNRFVTVPTRLNTMSNVQKMAADAEKK